MPRLGDIVRESCREVATMARSVAIDLDAAPAVEPGPEPELDPDAHFLEGSPEEVALGLLTVDAVNFGSGWFPTLRKRPDRSGYTTIATALAERFRREGPWSARELSPSRAPRWPACSARTPITS